MDRILRPAALAGTPDPTPAPWEADHAALARRAAAEGFVLLKNEGGLLPLPEGCAVALYGAGATRTVKGGTGSGDVNERRSVTIREGMQQAGFRITNQDWLDAYERVYDQSRLAWKQSVLQKCGGSAGEGLDFFTAYSTTPFALPAGPLPTPTGARVAVFVLARIAGEGADRQAGPGDYCLSGEERAQLAEICRLYPDVVVLINAGGPVDLSFLDDFAHIRALLVVSQPGMEGGAAVADVLAGRAAPGGRLTDSWALDYSDYPNAAVFSHNNGNLSQERYEEGLYVGYRYFDSFAVPVRYGFGEGLTYTTFSLIPGIPALEEGQAALAVTVHNTGARPGREVVQLYASLPEGRLEKEYRRLCAFGKTGLLAPGESETLTLRFGPRELASYDEARSAWLLEAGDYGLFAGRSLAEAEPVATLRLAEETLLEIDRPLCPPQQELTVLHCPPSRRAQRRQADAAAFAARPVLAWDLTAVPARRVDYAPPAPLGDEAEAIAASLSREQLIALAIGVPAGGQGGNLGAAGVAVPGSAGQTSACARGQGVADLVLADGPAGLRLSPFFCVRDGRPLPLPAEASLERGFFLEEGRLPNADRRYQYCTAFPVGTLLAQSWDPALLEAVGRAIGEEMERFGVDLWLAPGMNLHRNPLCGRNFEYYAEDPLLTGRMAAAITRGAQSRPGCGVTIKHFACNNQEDNRLHSDSILPERVLRELYLRGFGIAIREAQPRALMTSYNLVNGVHAANSFDLCTDAARREFGFTGVIMTDWTTTEQGPDCTAAGCMRAGNDLVMPGCEGDRASIRAALETGTLPESRLRECVTHLVRVALLSNRYEAQG